MCDYSLHAIASRPAEVGETLGTTYFRGTQTRGFANVNEQHVAVCLLPGTELAFEENVKYRGGWFRAKTVGYSVAKFCKIEPEIPQRHHDGLEFPDGSTLLLQQLVVGQRLKILQMPITNKGHNSAARENANVGIKHVSLT
jgi:hypothetical protein